MSRIGKKKIELPVGVTASVANGFVVVKGPKGELTRAIHPKVSIKIEDNGFLVDVEAKEDKFERSSTALPFAARSE